jgi:hypothetical protein
MASASIFGAALQHAWISRPSHVRSATVNFSASEILNPVTESSAISVA